MKYVFLPAYNEEKALPRLIEKFDREFKLLGEPYKIVVLDDGSADGTAKIAQDLTSRYPLELLRHVKNQGLGQTIKDGIFHVAKLSAPGDLIITMDCDDTHDPKYLSAAFKKIAEGYDLVILSRYQKGGGEEGLSFFRSFLSRGAGTFLKIFFPIRGVSEYSCGYRVYRAEALQKMVRVFGPHFIELTHLGFVALPEILIKLRMLGFRIGEVPFRLQYGQKPGKSKMNFPKTIAGYFVLVQKFFGRRAPRESTV